jgi:hypothetical protein
LRLGMLFRMLRSVDAIGNGVPIDYVGWAISWLVWNSARARMRGEVSAPIGRCKSDVGWRICSLHKPNSQLSSNKC